MKRFEKVIADAINEALKPFNPPSGPRPSTGTPPRIPTTPYVIADQDTPSTRRGPLPTPSRLKPLVFDTQPIG